MARLADWSTMGMPEPGSHGRGVEDAGAAGSGHYGSGLAPSGPRHCANRERNEAIQTPCVPFLEGGGRGPRPTILIEDRGVWRGSLRRELVEAEAAGVRRGGWIGRSGVGAREGRRQLWCCGVIYRCTEQRWSELVVRGTARRLGGWLSWGPGGQRAAANNLGYWDPPMAVELVVACHPVAAHRQHTDWHRH